MDVDTHSLFRRVAEKMGWAEKGGLDMAEEKLINSIGKTRRPATTSVEPMGAANMFSPTPFNMSDGEDDPEKENLLPKHQGYRNKPSVESSDDDFDQFLKEKATPKAKSVPGKPRCAEKKDSVVVVSSDSDGSFEAFLNRVKTPKPRAKKTPESSSEDSLKNFIVDDLSSDDDFVVEKKKPPKVKSATKHPTAKPQSRKPLLPLSDTPVFLGDSDEEAGIVVKSDWRTRHTKSKPPKGAENLKTQGAGGAQKSPLLSLSASPSLSSRLPPVPTLPTFLTPRPPPALTKRTCSAPSALEDSGSSDEEFLSLLNRLKSKSGKANTPTATDSKESRVKPPGSVPPRKGLETPGPKPSKKAPLDVKTPGKPHSYTPIVSQTEPRPGSKSRVAVCKTPGCFLQSLTAPGSRYGAQFKHNKEELTSKLYLLYNSSIFDGKLPAAMSVTWNKKMRKTAGYCITGQERGPGGRRYARIELSDKVCDAADRLRDTLVHEMCHAATWLINGVRDGHGNFWKLYARKATLAHPELPVVTRCHSYDIAYKHQYECTRCKNTIGRHSKSLDTERFVCALCTGKLVLLTPSKTRAPAPFASFVKENYGNVRKELVGQSHAEVMRKLSADFATKTKLSQS